MGRRSLMAPTGLKGAKLNRARVNAEKMMQDTCTIEGDRGSPLAFGVVATDVKCRVGKPIMPTSGSVPDLEINQFTVLYPVYFPYNTEVKMEDQITHNGEKYRIWTFYDDATPIIQRSGLMRKVKP
jgi:hypothetical protein